MAADAADGPPDDYGRVYRTVAAGGSALLLQQVLDSVAKGSPSRRKAAAYHAGPDDDDDARRRFKAGAKVGDLLDSEGLSTPLAVAVAHDQVETIRILLIQGHDPSSERLFYAPYDGEARPPGVTLAHLCVAPPSVPPESYGYLPGPPKLEALRVLVVGGLDVNARDGEGKSAIWWLGKAAGGHRYAALTSLLSLGARVNFEDEDWRRHGSPLLALFEPEDDDVQEEELMRCLRRLAKAGARTSGVFTKEGHSPLAMAAMHGHAAAVKWLVREVMVPVEERNPVDSGTAVHACVSDRDNTEALRVLLRAGASVSAVDRNRRTPLFACMDASYLPLLIDRGGASLLDVVDKDDLTPLMTHCSEWARGRRYHWPMPIEVLRHCSPAACRRVCRFASFSAADFVLADFAPSRLNDDVEKTNFETLVTDLLLARVPLLKQHVPCTLACVVANGAPRAMRAADEMARRRDEGNRWRAHDDLVGLALDHEELRAAEAAEARSRRRLEELEAQVAEMEEDEEDEEEGDDGGGPEQTEKVSDVYGEVDDDDLFPPDSQAARRNAWFPPTGVRR